MLRTGSTLLAMFVACGCAHTMIEGTQIPDTGENRKILQVLINLRRAMQARDSDSVTALISKTYFEDMGTADPADDYGYHELTTEILPQSMKITKEFYVNFEVHEVVIDGDIAHADLRYSSRARLELPSGSKWDTHREFNRVQLAREDGTWVITSGL